MGHSIGTSGMVAFSTILLVIAAILIIVAIDRLQKIPGYSTNTNLKNARNKLMIAQILTWIAAGVALILTLGYLAHHGGWLQTEWIHLILWLAVFGLVIAAGIYIGIAISDLDKANISNISNNQSANSYVWGALIVLVISFIVLIVSGGWRAYHKHTYESDLYVDPNLYGAAPVTMPMGAPEVPPGYTSSGYPQDYQAQVTVNPAAPGTVTNF